MHSLRKIAERLRRFLNAPVLEKIGSDISRSNAATQLQLKLHYEELKRAGRALPEFRDVGFRVFSQTDEDGLLLYIFSLLGVASKRCVDIGAGDGIEGSNIANLLINHGWEGLLLEGDEGRVVRGRKIYQSHPETRIFPPRFVHAWITRENINALVKENGFEGEIDLLSLDMDGMDYWIWQALEVVSPRAVVVEYQDILGPERSQTVPYQENFNAYTYPTTLGMPNYCGASLSAFVKLAKKKGYRLVGCNRYGFNAFFVRETLEKKWLPAIEISDCFKHPKVLWGMKERFPTVKDFPWQEI